MTKINIPFTSRRYYLTAQIDQTAIVHNCLLIKELLPKSCRLCVSVKCDAYGHGAEAVLPAIRAAEVDFLCVAAIHEARRLRELYWQGPVLLLGSELSSYQGSQKIDFARWLITNEIRITVTNREDLSILSKVAQGLSLPAPVHLKLDTGMSRMGLDESGIEELIDLIQKDKNIYLEGLYTHLATADEADKSFCRHQLSRLKAFVDKLKIIGLHIPIIHAANSGAAIDLIESHFNMIRCGISIYGCHSSPHMLNRPNLKPVLKLVSSLTLVKNIPAGSRVGYGCTFEAPRDMTIGIVPIGYGDGYDRRLSNRGKMTIDGKLVSVLGRVSMDQVVLDLTQLTQKGVDVFPGREVTIIDNNPNTPNSVESLAGLLDTVPHEIVTRLGNRIQRIPVSLDKSIPSFPKHVPQMRKVFRKTIMRHRLAPQS